jgi:hypothetical protein
LGFSTLIFSSFFSLHRYFGRYNPLIAFFAILYIFVAPLTSLFHTPEHFLQVKSPWTKILPLLYGFGRVLKEGISWRSIDTFYGHDSTYPKWQTVYARSTKN